MVKKASVLVGLISLFLVGCANVNKMETTTEYDSEGRVVKVVKQMELSDTGVYHTSIVESDEAKASAIASQAKAIQEVDIESQHPEARALLNKDKVDRISSLKVTPYSGEKPTEWTDVGNNVADKTGILAGAGVATVGIKELGKTVRKASENKEDVITIQGNSNVIETEETRQTATVSSLGENTNASLIEPNRQNGRGKEKITEESNDCSDDSPILHNGVCYSRSTALERGFISE
jgi:hypothetical protein